MASRKPATTRAAKTPAAEPITLERVPALLEATLSHKSFVTTPQKMSKATYEDPLFRCYSEPEVHRHPVLVALAAIGRRDLALQVLAAQPASWHEVESLRIDIRAGLDVADRLAALISSASDPRPVLNVLQEALPEAKEPAAAQVRACLASGAEKLLASDPDSALGLLLDAGVDLRRVASLATGVPLTVSRSVVDLCKRLLDAGEVDAAFAVLEHLPGEMRCWELDAIFTGARLHAPEVRARAVAFASRWPELATSLAGSIKLEDRIVAARDGVFAPPEPYDPSFAGELMDRGERDAARGFLASRGAATGQEATWNRQLYRAGLLDLDAWMATLAATPGMGEAHSLLIEGRALLARDPHDPGLERMWKRLEVLLAEGPKTQYDHGVFFGRVGEALAFGADVARARGADPEEILARERAFVASAREPREILVSTIPAWGRAGRIDGALETLKPLSPDLRASMAGRVAEACTDPAHAWAAIASLTDKRPFIAPQLLARLVRRMGAAA